MRLGSVLVVSAVMLFAGCADGGETSGEVGSAAPVVARLPSAEVNDGRPARIGDGTYERTLSRAEATAAGFDSLLVDEIIGDRDVVQFTVRFDERTYWQYQRNDDGPAKLGDRGRKYVDDDGHLVLISDNLAASGGATVIDWTSEGDQLTMTCVAGCLHDVAPDSNLVWEGTWTAAG